jgi:hypothetical protein
MASLACSFKTDSAQLTFDNRTDTLLCYYPSLEAAATSRCIQPINPMDKTDYSPGCGYGSSDEIEANPLTVIIAQSKGGPNVYDKTATCRTWKDSDRTLVIEREDAKLLVTGGPE